MADPKVMHILSQASFKTSEINKADGQHQHHRFELTDVAFEMLVLLYKTGTVKHHVFVVINKIQDRNGLFNSSFQRALKITLNDLKRVNRLFRA